MSFLPLLWVLLLRLIDGIEKDVYYGWVLSMWNLRVINYLERKLCLVRFGRGVLWIKVQEVQASPAEYPSGKAYIALHRVSH
jgi:hypothetical protein